jgi:hypothetical protein
MNADEEATQMLLLTASERDLVREGLGLLEATLSREESDQLDQIHAIFEQLGRSERRPATEQPVDGRGEAARQLPGGGSTS